MSVLAPVIDHLDLDTKLIYLLSGVTEYHPVEDIYVEVRNLRRTDESLRIFDVPVTAAGAVPKGGGKYTPRYAIFNHGWKVRPEDADHTLYVSGEQITDDGQSGPACIDTTLLTSSIIIQYEPPAAEIIRDEDSLRAINRMAFNDMITYDAENGYSGTGLAPNGHEIGTSGAPSNNITDFYNIATTNGFTVGSILGDLDLTEAALVDDIGDPIALHAFTFIGASRDRTTISIEDAPTVEDCSYYEAKVTGTLDGQSKLIRCLVEDLNYINGSVEACVLSGTGQITLGGGGVSEFLSCYSGVPGVGTPTIDMGGAGQSLSLRDYNGGILLTNKTGPEAISVDLGAGQVKLDLDGSFGTAGLTNGTIVVRGDGKVIDATSGAYLPSGTYGGLTLLNETVGIDSFSAGKYKGVVYLDVDSGFTGESDPYGLIRYPVDNLDDAVIISGKYNLNEYHFHSSFTLPSGYDFEGYIVTSHNQLLTFESGSLTNGISVKYAGVTGIVEGSQEYYDCDLVDLSGVAGHVEGCVLSGDIYFSGETMLRNCIVIPTNPATLHPQGNDISMPITKGYITLSDIPSGTINISLRAGSLTIDSSCTGGTVMVDIVGNGEVIDNSGAGCTVILKEFTKESITTEVWSASDAVTLLSDVSFVKGIEGGRWEIVSNQMIFYSDDNVTEVARFNLFDSSGSPSMTDITERVRV